LSDAGSVKLGFIHPITFQQHEVHRPQVRKDTAIGDVLTPDALKYHTSTL
jgi:hypothetical protein